METTWTHCNGTAPYSRRAFLKTSAVAAAGYSLAGGWSVHAQAGTPAMKGSVDVETDSQARTAAPIDRAVDLLSRPERDGLKPLLKDVCDWIMTQDLGSGVLKNTVEHNSVRFIFINGNLARVLLSGYAVLDGADYLAEALRWCDFLVSQQQPVVTSTGAPGGFWADQGAKGHIYFGDAGTATTMLALGYKHAGAARANHYLSAMEKYSRFIRFGCSRDPQGRGRGGTPGWIVQTAKDRGALGCGYYEGHLSKAPYIIATALSGAAFHSLLYSIDKQPAHAAVAANAARWILAQQLQSGEFPYIIDGQNPRKQHWPLDTMTYCGEGLIAAYQYVNEPGLRHQIASGAKLAVEWLLRTQNEDGSWGRMASPDQQRSPSCVTLLAWYFHRVDADPRIVESVRKYCRFLLDPVNQSPYGCRRLVRTTGFIGLVLADLLKPGVTFE